MFTFPFTIFSSSLFENLLSTSFDGVDEFVQTTVDLSGSTSFSISGWYFRATATQRLDIDQVDNANSNRIKLLINSGGGAVMVISGSSIFSPTLTTGWFHLVGVYDGSLAINQRMKLYVDGVLQGTPSGTPPTSIPTIGDGQKLLIGKDNGPGAFSNGNIDEVTVWGGALSDSDVLELYNSGDPNDPQAHSQSSILVNYWRMGDGDSATTIFDQVGSDNGTLVNMNSSNYVSDTP